MSFREEAGVRCSAAEDLYKKRYSTTQPTPLKDQINQALDRYERDSESKLNQAKVAMTNVILDRIKEGKFGEVTYMDPLKSGYPVKDIQKWLKEQGVGSVVHRAHDQRDSDSFKIIIPREKI